MHRNCGGRFEQLIIREHGYCFMRCDRCLAYLGGDRVKEIVERLMRTKVWPKITRA